MRLPRVPAAERPDGQPVSDAGRALAQANHRAAHALFGWVYADHRRSLHIWGTEQGWHVSIWEGVDWHRTYREPSLPIVLERLRADRAELRPDEEE